MKSEVEYSGLSESEVLASRERYGENILTPPARTPMWKLFLEKFSDPIIRILLVALLLSVAVAVNHIATGEAGMSALFEPAGIALAILLATVVGFLFEMSAAKKFDILNQVNDDLPVKVIRGGHMLEIPKREIVVGDIVMLNAGDEIPADGAAHRCGYPQGTGLQIGRRTSVSSRPLVLTAPVPTSSPRSAANVRRCIDGTCRGPAWRLCRSRCAHGSAHVPA